MSDHHGAHDDKGWQSIGELTARILSVYLAKAIVPPSALPKLVADVRRALNGDETLLRVSPPVSFEDAIKIDAATEKPLPASRPLVIRHGALVTSVASAPDDPEE